MTPRPFHPSAARPLLPPETLVRSVALRGLSTRGTPTPGMDIVLGQPLPHSNRLVELLLNPDIDLSAHFTA